MTTANRLSQAVKAANIIIVSESVADLFKEARLTEQAITKATKRKESVGTSMLTLAKESESVDEFLEDCDRMEKKHRKSSCADKTIPRCWTQAKSNIKQALSKGLTLSDFNTEGAMRKKLNELRAEEKKAAASKEAEEKKAALDALDILMAQVNVSFIEANDRAALANHLKSAIEGYIAPASTTGEQVVNQ